MENNSNITTNIIEAINTILNTLFSSIDNNVYSVLDDITFINSDIITDSYFEKILGTSTSNGILLISNSLLFGFLLYYAIKYLFAHFTYQQVERPSQFIFKLIIWGICINFSYFFIEQILNFVSNISLAIRGIGESLFHKNICFSELILEINNNISIDSSSLDVFSLLFIQIIVSIVLLILFSMDYSSNNLMTKFIYIGAIYALIKSNSFVRDFIGGVSTTFTQNVENIFKKVH